MFVIVAVIPIVVTIVEVDIPCVRRFPLYFLGAINILSVVNSPVSHALYAIGALSEKGRLSF